MYQKGGKTTDLLSCVFQKFLFLTHFYLNKDSNIHQNDEQKPFTAISPTQPSIFHMWYIYQSEHLKSHQDCNTHKTNRPQLLGRETFPSHGFHAFQKEQQKAVNKEPVLHLLQAELQHRAASTLFTPML